MNNIPAYSTISLNTEEVEKSRYLFESIGKKSIFKAIEYSYVKKISGRKVFNLGFGDYNEKDGTIIDDVVSNNGDMRKVFSTVLNTVPKFFRENNDAAIWIQGSDSAEDYKAKCKPSCTKKCDDVCKNHNRRINAYKYYVDRNFVNLSKEYDLFGYMNDKDTSSVKYIPGKEYVGILVFKKK